MSKSSLHSATSSLTSGSCFSQSATVSIPLFSPQPSLPLYALVAVDVTDEVAVEVADDDAVVVSELDAVVVSDVVADELTLEDAELDTDVVADDVTVDDCVELAEDVAVELPDVDAELVCVEEAVVDAVVDTVVVSDVRSQPCRSPAKYRSRTSFKCPTTLPQFDLTCIAGSSEVHSISGVT